MLLIDAFNQVFYSIGVCVGVMFAYGSYNPIRKPVIQDAIVMAVLDFVYSILAGFITWGVIGYLFAKGDPAYTQTSSVGLAFVAFPTAASLDGSKGWFGLFCFTLFIAGIDTAFSYIEAFATNIVDATGCERWKAALGTCVLGIILSIPFTTNFGWTLFDLTEHYVTGYIIIIVGLLQCIAVAWLFEYESTAAVSENHRKSLKAMALCYWIPVVVIAFYANFAFPDQKIIGIVVICLTTLLALVLSKKQSGMKFNSWYHEIVLCGVDKLSMSITSLSNPDASRSDWMLPFESYFGMCIKFVNPAALIFILMNNLSNDLASPYADETRRMQIFGTIYVMISLLVIFVPMFACTWPEEFTHNVNLEFMADNIFEAKLRLGNKLRD